MKANNFRTAFGYSDACEDRISLLEAKIAAAGRLTRRHHSASGIKSRVDFFCEFLKAYKGGKATRVGQSIVPDEDAAIMVQSKQCEAEVLHCFSAMLDGIVFKFARRFGRDCDDLFGEAFKAFFDALVHYTGESTFSTFLNICVRRHLSGFCAADSMIRVPRDVEVLAKKVVGLMAGERLTFDEALARENVSGKNVAKVTAAMHKVSNATELDIEPSELAECRDAPFSKSIMRLVDSVKLGNLEKAVLKAFMEAPMDRMGLSKGCAGLINPVTGRPYSRAAISAAWKQARKKLAVALRDVA